MTKTIHATAATFESEVLLSTEPVLVDFYADWCGPCQAIAPSLEELAVEYQDRAKIVKVDIETQRELAIDYGVQSIPTLLFFSGGELIRRQVGAAPKVRIARELDDLTAISSQQAQAS